MIKITNNVETIEVSKGAYEGIYKRLGYQIVKSKKSKSHEDNENHNNDSGAANDNDKFSEELLEKPISEWNKGEVKKFASINGIDLSETKNANEAKELIKAWLEENN